MSAEVGGISALTALEILSADEKSQVLAFVSKPPADAVRQHIIAAMKATGKPVVALFLGFSSPLRVRITSGLPRRWMKPPDWHVYCLA